MNVSNGINESIDAIPLEQQPAVVRDMLSIVNVSRRQFSLYGTGHPNCVRAAEELSAAIDNYLAEFDRTTFVFTLSSVIANDHNYVSSNDGLELFERLRARGVMAISLVGSPGPEQCAGFLAFLNAEPTDLRAEGGASSYLRRRSITRIVATDAVYTRDSDSDEDGAGCSPALGIDVIDRAVAAAVDWLSRQDEEDGEKTGPRLPIIDILSQPDQAAKLIREAVTKLHASRRQETSGELAGEVVHDLKDLAAFEKDKWDKATPQIRKAISKLPKGLRPEISGFNDENEDSVDSDKTFDIGEVESKVANVLDVTPARSAIPDAFRPLFGAKAHGLLSSWKRELRPGSVMESSGRTLETLMAWETRAAEHERIARALAGLAPRAVAMKDMASARMIVASLVKEMRRGDSLSWRLTNVRAALAAIDAVALKEIVEESVANGDAGAREMAAYLVETFPDLSLEVVNLLGSCGDPAFSEALKRGIAAAGTTALGPLTKLLREGTGAPREMALEALIRMKGAAAIHEVAQALSEAEPTFIIRAFSLLPAVRVPQVTELCVGYLSHGSPEVRCAALGALGELADPAAAPAIAQIASKRSLKQDDTAERIQAIKALAKIGGPESIGCLRKLATHRPILGRNHYEFVRTAAEKAFAEANAQRCSDQERAA